MMMIEPTMMRPEDVPCTEDEPLMIHYYDDEHCLRVALKTCQHDGTLWSSDGRRREDHIRLGRRGGSWDSADGWRTCHNRYEMIIKKVTTGRSALAR